MKKYALLIAAACIAVILALVIVLRITIEKGHFDKTVREALSTSEGYDQKFIDMVNRLEAELALRAQFGYSGNKDPMTGSRRMVVQPVAVARPVVQIKKTAVAGGATPAPEPVPVVQEKIDPVKLTAIIGDATGKKITAVIMDGERSYSVEAGDNVAGRKITKITGEGIYMESETDMYFYDISGNKVVKAK